MDPELLETFLAVVRAGGMRRAAGVLHVTQPGVSARVRELEARLGARLFERVGRRIELTPTGRLLEIEAPTLLAAHAALERRVREHAGSERRTLRAATIDAASIYVLPEVYLEFRRLHPDVQLTVQVVDSRRVLSAVASREADVGVLALPAAHPDVELVPVFEEELVCVAGNAHPLALRAARLAAVAEEPLVLYAQGSTTRATLDAVFESHGLSANVVMETASPEAMKRLVEVGVGLSILPEPLVRDDLASGRLRLVRLEDAAFVRRLATAVHRGRELGKFARRFLELVHRRYPPLGGAAATARGSSSRGPRRSRRTSLQ